MMEAVRTSETSVDNHFTRQYIPEDNSENYYYYYSIEQRRSVLALHVKKLSDIYGNLKIITTLRRTRN
jgi:hypothetical protein